MKTSRILVCLIFFAFLSQMVLAQGDDDEKKGKLKKFGDDYHKKENDEDDNDDDGGFSIWAFIDPFDIVDAIANMKPGPYPYNPAGQNFLPDSALPGGVVQLQGSYFQHNSNLAGFHWKYFYNNHRFSFSADLYNLFETVGSRTDRLGIGGMRLGWDLLSRPDLILAGQAGVRSILDATDSPTGPEVGLKMTAFPGAPLVLESEGTLALIRGKTLSTLSINLGLMVWRVEFLVGGQLFRAPSISIDGWKLGMRFWL